MQIECDIYILTECWNSKVVHYPVITNFDTYYTKSNCNQNDGVVVFAKSGLKCTVEEFKLVDASCLLVKVKSETLVIAIYRSPSKSNANNFLSSLDDLLNIYNSFKNIIITGDINIHIGNNSEDRNMPEYLNLLASHGILQGHDYPTRGSNCIDHSMIKTKHQVITLVFNAPLTDHSAVLTCLKSSAHKIKQQNTINKINYDNIQIDIKDTDFGCIMTSTDVEWAAHKLVTLLSNCIAKNSLTVVVPRRFRLIKPWMSRGLLRCIKNRDRMHLSLKRNPSNQILSVTYCRYKNYCNDLLKRLKRVYEQTELNKHAKNPKMMWKTIKTIGHSVTQNMIPTDLLRIANTPMESVERVNIFFANVGKELADRITGSHNQNSAVPLVEAGSSGGSMIMLETTEKEVESILVNLKTERSVGWDGISTKILKNSKYMIIPPLTHIINLSISNGIFPSVFKISIIHPIHKSGSKDNITNYRPISVLPALSKVMEKIINKRLLSYLEKENILSPNQYGFRAGYSTSDAATNLTESIALYLDSKMKCLGVFLDLAKAFDTVSIPRLLNKMGSIGV